MIKAKHLIVMFLVLGLFNVNFAEKRPKPKSMKELTDQQSPSYVPYPYPKKRGEIIADLEYAINKLLALSEGHYIDGNTPTIKKILLQLLEKNSEYKIGEITKVKNRSSRMAHDYTWLIFIMDENNEIAARVSMRATGLFGSAAASGHGTGMSGNSFSSGKGPKFSKTDEEVLNILSGVTGRTVTKSKVKHMERVAFQSTLGDLLAPMWEIKLHDNTLYYYSIKRDTVYVLKEKIPWKKNKNGIRMNVKYLVPNSDDFVPDTVNDEILVLKKLKRKDENTN